ncbi:MAG: PilZ domain-containing protein [Deferrisomatales bacterium]|nr:PilZ domain-containing protein [Deferrisomatales bacterium]
MGRDWNRELLHRSGLLFQGASPWGEVACIDVCGPTLLLSPLSRHRELPPEAGLPACFEAATPFGVFRASGILVGNRTIEINRVPQEVMELEVHPGGIDRRNRRAHFRVAVNLKGELALFSEEDLARRGLAVPAGGAAASLLEDVARGTSSLRRLCLVREMGIGGARVFTAPPEPLPGTLFLLDLSPTPGEPLTNLPGNVIESLPPGGPHLPIQIRLRFDPLSGAPEARLARYLARVQREMLQKGIRG